MGADFRISAELAASITRKASLQTYFTIRFLVRRAKVDDAYRAYGYFRWVDDCLDQKLHRRADRAAFIARQTALIESCYQGRDAPGACVEEQMLVHLVQSHGDSNSGLSCYIRNLLSVMAFDAERRGRLITQSELKAYAHTLAVAVTEALHYFIGSGRASPRIESRYLSATGAHVAHMLRDTWEDNQAGYFNIPLEVVEAGHISPLDVESHPYREWVRSRVEWARSCFYAGRSYLARIENIRYRLACYAYAARFADVLDSIERDGYLLRPTYPARKSLRGGLQVSWAALSSALRDLTPAAESGIRTAR